MGSSSPSSRARPAIDVRTRDDSVIIGPRECIEERDVRTDGAQKWRPVLIRPIREDHKDALLEGLRRLTPESRYRRFFSPMSS